MCKILILEDRRDRQISFLPNGISDMEEINAIPAVYMPLPNESKFIIEKINTKSFEFSSETTLIIVHHSKLSNGGITYINEFAKKNATKVVFFSGGIGQVFYNNDGFEQLFLNSTEFYSDLLVPFLKKYANDDSETILELSNKNWKLSYLMLYRQLSQNLKISEKDESDPYTYYNITNERLINIGKILHVENENDVDKLFKLLIQTL